MESCIFEGVILIDRMRDSSERDNYYIIATLALLEKFVSQAQEYDFVRQLTH